MSHDVFLRKDMPSVNNIITISHLGGVNRRFQASLVKYQNLHIVKTTWSISL